ncbi:BRCT domain-containing protein [Marilutibacter alkalisoli]|uniref:NAD-dependent DNA ligase n=1 Tax=Marilutibacter alkalisoli TaxID=2591633 RepID=A0A514BU51_9GAMM|nr:BRCT domain-containing protein [Lysobacter alkalisoli]QDH70867.1 NAD-dependent DNA ligase [Lysobacter alkalisoli]
MSIYQDGAPGGAMTWRRRLDRSTDELLGLCRGVLADGALAQQEAEFLLDWIQRNGQFREHYPFNVLFDRLSSALVDGFLDSDEERDLLGTLTAFVGGETLVAERQVASLSTALPLDDPQPRFAWDSPDVRSGFVLTGTFAFGSRKNVADAVIERGGTVLKNPVRAMRFLVIGEIGSRDWVHSSYGRKIEKAVQLRDEGLPVSIISEAHWASHL